MNVFGKDKNRLRRAASAERAVAATVPDGRRVAGSGNQAGASRKADVNSAEWLIEVKDTISPRYSLTLLSWRTIEGQAIRAAKEPAMVLNLAGRKLVVISYDAFLALQGSPEKPKLEGTDHG